MDHIECGERELHKGGREGEANDAGGDASVCRMIVVVVVVMARLVTGKDGTQDAVRGEEKPGPPGSFPLMEEEDRGTREDTPGHKKERVGREEEEEEEEEKEKSGNGDGTPGGADAAFFAEMPSPVVPPLASSSSFSSRTAPSVSFACAFPLA